MYSLLNRCFLIDYGAWVAHPFRPEIYIKYQLGGYYIEVFVFFSKLQQEHGNTIIS